MVAIKALLGGRLDVTSVSLAKACPAYKPFKTACCVAGPGSCVGSQMLVRAGRGFETRSRKALVLLCTVSAPRQQHAHNVASNHSHAAPGQVRSTWPRAGIERAGSHWKGKPVSSGLSPSELLRASQLARWSGLCYLPEDVLGPTLHDDGLRLLASGRTNFTSWFVAEGPTAVEAIHDFDAHQQAHNSAIPLERPVAVGAAETTTSERSPVSTGWSFANGSSENGHAQFMARAQGHQSHAARHASNRHGMGHPTGHAQHSAGPYAAAAAGQRYIFLRGVQWSAPDVDAVALGAALSRFWPSTFAGSLTKPPAALVAHSGVAELSLELFPKLLPYISNLPEGTQLVFAGHSLGGSLGKLLWCLSLLNGYRPPDKASCYTFGSPPVLAHKDGGGGQRVMQLLRVPPHACLNFVLENDPIPRAMLTVDPYFAALRRLGPVAGLLQLREALLGAGSLLSSGRFLYENVGQLHLLKWSSRGCEAVNVGTAEVDELLHMTLDAALKEPTKPLQYFLDHHHSSYANDLQAAAYSIIRSRRHEASEQPRHATDKLHRDSH